jgi:hypothetical protein
MKILKQNQYNQGVGKFKLLSSNSGVGSIITTKLGTYVLISDINKWHFVKWINSRIQLIRSYNTDDRKVFELSEKEIANRGLDFIKDQRFINFIKSEKNLENLVCLVGIPHMALDENFNTPIWTKKVNNQILPSHPIAVALYNAGEEYKSVYSSYQVQGTHFPKWFKNDKGELKKISVWQNLWKAECNRYPDSLKLSYFVPPRDATKYLNREVPAKNEDGNPIKIREYKTLEQTNLILICPNGHLSDIPWEYYLNWKTQKLTPGSGIDEKGENLFEVDPCCTNPHLIWTESKTKSEGYGSIFIHCNSCGTGDGGRKNGKALNDYKSFPKINLEGINGLKPKCRGQKPWELDIDNPLPIPFENCFKRTVNNIREEMQVALVTANNVYYANGYSSLFIPMHLAENKSKEILDGLKIIEERYKTRNSTNPISKDDYWDKRIEDDFEEFLSDNGIIVTVDKKNFKNQLKSEFLYINSEPNADKHEEYRWQEYRCFSQNSLIQGSDKNKGLRFKDIKLPNELTGFFKKIQQVEELKVTNVQLDFTRVKPKERIVVHGIVQESSSGQNIFSIDSKELFALPANETLGEGIFFEFSNEKIHKWVSENVNELENRFGKYLKTIPDSSSQGISSKMKIYNNGYKHFLIHSFSHVMMRELEFSCGYPSASLRERLYISTNPEKIMSGVLIYTAEGAEGSMGGLVSQGEPEKIVEILKRGLERSTTCSSDPLCWESEGQGIFDLNLSACFSCSLVAETACEEMNLGLDRRVLVDEEFGFFKILN